MIEQASSTKVLVTVLTYPHPSESYQELVCTAGITESLDWVRLYPINYRYLPNNQRFHKFQWIEVGLKAASSKSNDDRKETRRPDLDSIKLLGETLSTAKNWRERRELIDRLPHYTVNQLKALHGSDKTSLGVVRPKRVLDLEIKSTEAEWKPEWQALFKQLRLFGPQQKPLEKLPYSFKYVFECEDSSKPHTATCTDWELGVLFLKQRDKLGSEKAAAESVKDKFLGELCRADKDTRFFMGTLFPYNVWLVLGVFWPPKIEQASLF